MSQEAYDNINISWVDYKEDLKSEILEMSEEYFRSQYEPDWGNLVEQNEKDLS